MPFQTARFSNKLIRTKFFPLLKLFWKRAILQIRVQSRRHAPATVYVVRKMNLPVHCDVRVNKQTKLAKIGAAAIGRYLRRRRGGKRMILCTTKRLFKSSLLREKKKKQYHSGVPVPPLQIVEPFFRINLRIHQGGEKSMQKGISVLICLHIITTYTLVVSSSLLLLLPYEKCNCIFSSAVLVRSTEDYPRNFFVSQCMFLFSLFFDLLSFFSGRCR